MLKEASFTPDKLAQEQASKHQYYTSTSKQNNFKLLLEKLWKAMEKLWKSYGKAMEKLTLCYRSRTYKYNLVSTNHHTPRPATFKNHTCCNS